jgi:outer membrane protein TolC
MTRSQYWPVVGGFYERSFAKPDPHNGTLIDWGYIWNAGFSVSFPVFDGFAREGNIIQQKARFKQAQINLVDAEETTLFEITKALLSIHDAEEFVHSQRLNLTRAEEGLRLAEVGYKEGTNTQVEMIDAQSALTQAKANYYQSIYTHIIAKLDLQKAMGTLAVPKEPESAVEQKSVSAQDSDLVSNIQ